VRDILGLNGHMLNNVDSLPEPGNRVGTGRVRRFAAVGVCFVILRVRFPLLEVPNWARPDGFPA